MIQRYRDVDDLKDALDNADRATPGFEECSSRPSQMMGHREDTVPGITQRMLNRRIENGDLMDGDALTMVRKMWTIGEFRGLGDPCHGGPTDEDADEDTDEYDSYDVRFSQHRPPRRLRWRGGHFGDVVSDGWCLARCSAANESYRTYVPPVAVAVAIFQGSRV